MNTVGHFSCVCPEGYIVAEDGKMCVGTSWRMHKAAIYNIVATVFVNLNATKLQITRLDIKSGCLQLRCIAKFTYPKILPIGSHFHSVGY